MNWTARFAAGVAPAPIKIRFGYRRDQLAGIYLPLLALALALTLIATIMSRAGYAALALSAILLGTMVWMGAASQLDADAPLRILLFGNPLAEFAALFVDLWPPLFCVAIGVALGSRMRGGRVRRKNFGEVFWPYAIVPLIVTCVVGALPEMYQGNWFAAAGWLAATPLFLLARRAWNRVRARSSTRQLAAGELKERVSALAARAGCPQVKLFISFPTNSQVANAFALPRRTIFFTAPLVRSLSKCEVDAVAAHELSHTRPSRRWEWTALCLAMLLSETQVRDVVSMLPGGLAVAMIVPIAMFFAGLHGTRKREFAADARSAAAHRRSASDDQLAGQDRSQQRRSACHECHGGVVLHPSFHAQAHRGAGRPRRDWKRPKWKPCAPPTIRVSTTKFPRRRVAERFWFFRTFDEPRLALCRRGEGRYKGVKLWWPRVAGYGTVDIVA